MKTSERHQLKEDEFQIALSKTRDQIVEQRRPIALAVVGAIVVAAAIAGFAYWQRSTNERAAAMLAEGVVTASAPVLPAEEPQPPGQLNPPPPRPAKSFLTEKDRAEAAIKQFDAAAKAYPSSKPGIAANYRAAALLAEQGRASDAETRFNDVIQRDGDGLYGRMSRLGIATLQVQTKKFDQAIAALQTLSQRADTDLPVDAVLMQLGDAYQRAGRAADAVRTYTRVVDEFPLSAYTSDARRRLDDLKTVSAPAARS